MIGREAGACSVIDAIFDVLERALFGTGKAHVHAWFALSLVAGGLFSTIELASERVFSEPYVVQDDARQHVFWMQAYGDRELFANDLIAQYFRSVAPLGHRGLYRAFSCLGIDPLDLAKGLPVALSIASCGFFYLFSMRVCPEAPFVSFVGAQALAAHLWLTDTVSNATPRAFGYPLFAAFLAACASRSSVGIACSVSLLALFYPALALVATGAVLGLVLRSRGPEARCVARRGACGMCLAGLAGAFVGLLPYVLERSPFGPVLTREDAASLPELGPSGRSAFFDPNPGAYWLCGERSGLFPREWCVALDRVAPNGVRALVTLAFAAVLCLELARAWRSSERVWLRVLVSSALVFLAAHVLAFRLHLPSRYSQPILRIFACAALASAVGFVIRDLCSWARARGRWARSSALVALFTIACAFLAAPFAEAKISWSGFVHGMHPALYRFLRGSPRSSVIASLDAEADNIPVFGGRTVIVSREHAIPYHVGYYRALRRRASDLLSAQYSRDPDVVRRFIEGYRVTHWIVRRDAFLHPRVAVDGWIASLRLESLQSADSLDGTRPPLVAVAIPACHIFSDDDLIVLDARCVLETLPDRPPSERREGA